MSCQHNGVSNKVGLRQIFRKYGNGEKLVALTAYDALTARFVDECDTDIILVGDSLGMTMLGYTTTVPVTMDDMLHHTRAVCRGVKHALVVGDLPFLSYHLGLEQALVNAGRFLQDAGADAVKLEGGELMSDTIRGLVSAGIPVMGHIGILPQQVFAQGGYRVQGRTNNEVKQLLLDAKSVEEAGAFAIVLEGITSDIAKEITEHISIPTIGIGAGINCSGQIQVIHDILGLYEDFQPKHSRCYQNLSQLFREGISEYVSDVRTGKFPGEKESFS